MKLSYVFFIMVFLLGQLQVAGATVPAYTLSSAAPGHTGCDEMAGEHHDRHSVAHKISQPHMTSHSQQTIGHDCCDQAPASSGCPICGDHCDCGMSCHIINHSFGMTQTVAIRMTPLIVKAVEPSDFSFISAELAFEKRPPKHA